MAILDGWQRLWVAVAVFWTVGGLSIGYVNWPSPSADPSRMCVPLSEGPPQTIEEARAMCYTVRQTPDGGWTADPPQSPESIVEHVQATLIVWAIPLVSLYFLGWGIGQARRRHLNGWQRLWLVVTVPWAVLFVGLALVFPFTNGTDGFLIALACLASAVVVPLLLYAAGLTVAWILRGFLG